MKLAILSCHFNPGGFFSPRRNLMRFMRQMDNEGMALFVAELAYDESPWFLPESSQTLRLRTASSNIMWHKENLLNLLERMVPAEFDALAWIDADVWFERRDWASAAITSLGHHAVVQLFQQVNCTAQDGRLERIIAGAGAAGHLNPAVTTPGFAWAARRSLWREGGGLFERAVIGGGDMLNASVWLPTDPPPYAWLQYSGVPQSLERLQHWCRKEGGASGIEGTLWHEWHGTQQNRKYRDRHHMMQGLDVERHVSPRSDGLLEFSSEVSGSLRRKIRVYFSSRQEDGPATQTDDFQSWSAATRHTEIVVPLPLAQTHGKGHDAKLQPGGEAAVLMQKGDQDLDRLLMSLHALRQRWKGPTVVIHFGAFNGRLSAICSLYAVYLHEMGQEMADGDSTLLAETIRETLSECPFARMLYLPAGAIVLEEVSFPEILQSSSESLAPEWGRPLVAIRAEASVTLHDVSHTRAEASCLNGILVCSGNPEAWSEPAWEQWCLADAEATFALTEEIPVSGNTGVVFVISAGEASEFQRNWLTFKFPVNTAVRIYLVDFPLSEFWLPCQREGVSISEIASETLGRLDVFLSDVLASIPEKDRLVFLSSYTTGHPTAPLWDEKKWEQADIVLHTTSVALREAEITGNWFIPTPLIGAFSRQALQVCATHSAAETQGYGDLQSMIWQVAVEAGFEVTLSNLTGKEHLSPAGYRYCPLEPCRKRVPDAVASSRLRGTEGPGRLHLAEDVVVISLPERKDRQERIAALLEREQIAFRFVEGVRVKFEDVSPEEYADCFWNDFKLQGGRENYIVGMAGCKRAHLRCLQHAYESGFESLLIFEDDMALEEGWREVLERAVQELPRGWHQLCLSATLYREAQPYSAHLKRITASYKNTAILFSKEGIASALKAGLKARNEIDCCWTEHVHPFGLSFVVHPQITYQTGGFSSIVNVVRDRTA